VAAAVCLAVAVVFSWVRLSDPVPPLQAMVHTAPTFTVPGATPPPVEVPAQGSLDLEASAGDAPGLRLARLDISAERPIGSVAKTMTALVVLDAHPLGAGDDGPVLTMTAGDVALFHQAVSIDGSAVEVHQGERLTERELLLGLMLPSANNLAETLARWVAGSHDAFVARLNARARDLGMTGTHFDDPSGYSPQTTSTAADLVLLGRAALAVPALAGIVATTQATFAGTTTLHNLDTLLATVPGWLGIKTGETPSAGGCLLFAARRTVGDASAPVTVVGAVLDQPALAGALAAARVAVESAFAGYAAVRLGATTPPITGTVTSAWGDTASLRLTPGGGGAVALRPGTSLQLLVRPGRFPTHLDPGDAVATLEARAGPAVLARWPVVAATPLGGASLWWRLFERAWKISLGLIRA
jgi:D-alanyl-D-alanine carboxypeptidase (penicillin-binding protein 5/6)